MAKANKINVLHVYEVSGSGEFPFDMLRYDTCWPGREAETHKLGLETQRLGSGRRQTRTVQIVGLKGPTLARWESFGWKVGATVQERSVG